MKIQIPRRKAGRSLKGKKITDETRKKLGYSTRAELYEASKIYLLEHYK